MNGKYLVVQQFSQLLSYFYLGSILILQGESWERGSWLLAYLTHPVPTKAGSTAENLPLKLCQQQQVNVWRFALVLENY